MVIEESGREEEVRKGSRTHPLVSLYLEMELVVDGLDRSKKVRELKKRKTINKEKEEVYVGARECEESN